MATSTSDAFGRTVAASIIEEARSEGADLIQCDPAGDPALVLDCAARLATQDVDGWITVQTAVVGDALCAIGPRDVPLIAVTSTPASCQTAVVGADDRRAGLLAGQEVARPSSDAGCGDATLLIVANGSTNEVRDERVEGIREGVAGICRTPPQTETMLMVDSQEGAFDAVQDAVTTLPDEARIMVAAADDTAALGAAAAIPEARAEHVTLVGIGADERVTCAILANPGWVGDVALFPERYGQVVVPALLAAIAGQDVPQRIDVDSSFVTAETLGATYDLTECQGR